MSGSTIKIFNCPAALAFLFFSLSGHWPEDTRVCWPWYTWCAEMQVDSRDQPMFFSDTVISYPKFSIICFLSKKLLVLGLIFSTSVKVFYFPLFLGLTGSWLCCFLMIKVSGVFFINYCKEYKEYLVFHLKKFLLVQTNQKHLNCLFEYIFLRVFLLWYFY